MKRIRTLMVVLACFFTLNASIALASGSNGSGTEPPQKESASTVCKYFPLLCLSVDSGSNGSGTEPPMNG